ncbi:aminoglycoside phosphotransferase family protein [Nocardia sp. X0981]
MPLEHSGEIAAKMLEATKRLADTIAEKLAPRVSEAHQQFPHRMRYGLDRTTHCAGRSAAEIHRIGAAEHAPRGRRDRSEVSAEEARERYAQVLNREPDAAGTGNRVNLVETTAGPAVIRFAVERPAVTMLKKWMPENTAIRYALACGVRTPEILYAGKDLSTGREFTLMRYVPGVTRETDDPELLNWLPDLLDQVQLLSSRPLPSGMDLDIPEWQRQMIQHADDAFHNLPPEHRSRLDRLGIGPLSHYIQPDLSRAGEPTVFAHNDLYYGNLRLDDRGKLWMLDWETAGPGDPLYNAGLFLARMSSDVDDVARARATDMWLERIMPANSSVDTGATLGMYQRLEDWRQMTMYTGELMPRQISADPGRADGWADWYHSQMSRHPEFWPDVSKDELRATLRECGS